MNTLAELLRLYCATLFYASPEDADATFAKIRGRDDFVPRLTRWLNNSQRAFPELIRATAVDHVKDRGLDVLVEALNSGERVGFQIKSNNDLKEGFLREVKAQYIEAQGWNCGLYIIVLGCQTDRKKHWNFYQHLVVEVPLWLPNALVLSPEQAVSLWKACDQPLTKTDFESLLQERTWSRFFHDTKQEDRAEQFLRGWPHLEPPKRFVKPREWDELRATVSASPLTLLSGPPTVGKTFAVANLLYERYAAGHPVAWFAPTPVDVAEAPVPAFGSPEGFKRSISRALHQIGLPEEQNASDAHDAISRLLEKGAWVFIEDPFGATDVDYNHSLQTYEMFDLEQFVEAISRGGKRRNCRIILTSRDGLFQKWQEDMKRSKRLLPEMSVVSLSPESYEFITENPAERPLTKLAAQLLLTSGKIDVADYDDSKPWVNSAFSMSRVIGEKAQTPREVELLVSNLPTPATWEAIESVRSALHRDWKILTQNQCHTHTDAERLFLLLSCAQRSLWYKNRDFSVPYALLHRALELNGDAATDEEEARRRFWGLYYTLPATRPKHRRPRRSLEERDAPQQPVSVENVSDLTDFDLDQMLEIEPVAGRTDVLPVHSSVEEAIAHELTGHGDFLSCVVGILEALEKVEIVDSVDTHEHEEEFDAKQLRYEMTVYLLGFGPQLSPEAAQQMAVLLPQVAPHYEVMFGRLLAHRVLAHWEGLPVVVRDAFLAFIQSDETEYLSLGTICGCMASRDDFPAEEAWKFYRLLMAKQFQSNWIHCGGILNDSPWEYLVRHIDSAPLGLRLYFDAAAVSQTMSDFLDAYRIFSSSPLPLELQGLTGAKFQKMTVGTQRGMVLMIGRLFARYWEQLPEQWRQTVFSEAVRRDAGVMQEIYWGMAWPLRAKTCPQSLIQLLRDQLSHSDKDARAKAAVFNVIYREELPAENFAAVQNLFSIERDWNVIKHIMQETRDGEEREAKLVSIVKQRLLQPESGFDNLPNRTSVTFEN